MIRYEEDPIVIREDVNGSVSEVWDLLIRAYGEEGLTPDQMDEASRTLSVSRFELRRERSGVPMTAYLDCGLSSTGRLLAENARIQATIISRVSLAGTSASQVSTRFEGVAFPADATGGRAQDCYTTGAWERDIVDRIREALGEDTSSAPMAPSPGAQPAIRTSPVKAPGPGFSSFPVEPGTRIRIHTSPTERYTGTFLAYRNDTVLMRRSRITTIPLSSVSVIEVHHARTPRIVAGALIGAVAGIAIATGTGIGITGDHEIQGKILNPGLGGVAGGLAGAWLASKLFGTSWEEISLDPGPQQDGSRGVGLGLRIPWPWPR
jgi:hypothetical protein